MHVPRLFLSYSTKDKRLAGEIRKNFSDAGFDVFLAHEDLTPTDEWLKRIEAELKRCNVFIAILTENFRKSEWTDQEAGYALSRSRASRKKCLVLSFLTSPLPRVPHGFLKDFQALRVNETQIEEACKKAADIIEDKLGLLDFKKDHVISRLALAGNFKKAKENLKELRALRPFSVDQSKRIAQAAVTNTQIYWPQENGPVVRRLLFDHFDELDKRTKQRLTELFER